MAHVGYSDGRFSWDSLYGKSFSVPGASMLEIKGGQIHRNRDYWSLTTFRQQLGMTQAVTK